MNPVLPPRARSYALQWSHVLEDVEIPVLGAPAVRGRYASMEPRPRGRGNCAGRHERNEIRRLQWSHVLEDVEIVLDATSGMKFAGFNGATS